MSKLHVFAVVLAGGLLVGCAKQLIGPGPASLLPEVLTHVMIEKGDTPEQRLAKAQRIKKIAEDAQSWMELTGAGVDELAARARARLGQENLEISQLIIANRLIDASIEWLRQQIAEGKLPEDYRMKANELFKAIIAACELHGA